MAHQRSRNFSGNYFETNPGLSDNAPDTRPANGTRLMSRRQFLAAGLGAAALGGAGLGYAWAIEPLQIEVTSVELALPRLAAAFDGYKIVQFGDIHLDNIQMGSSRLAAIVSQINRLNPGLVVITGDFITASHHTTGKVSEADLARPLQQLAAPDGVCGVLGNHDHEEAPAMVRRVLHTAGIVELSNDVHSLERADSALHIAGLDDVLEQQADFDRVLGKLPQAGAAILLAHEPDVADATAASGRFDVQLSGHSHGGQIVAPLFGPLILPVYGKKYPQGLYQIQDMLLYTNKGVGTVPPRMRFNCRPEITQFTLKAKK